MRLNQFLAKTGLGARRKVEELIKNGSVKVNGKTISKLAVNVDPNKDDIEVSGKKVFIENKVYIVLNKPAGFLTTASDERGRKTVLDLVKVKERIFPVGRLDKNSRGLLLLTNDGNLMEMLLHPRHKIAKLYEVKVSGVLSAAELNKFKQGIVIERKKTEPAEIRPIDSRLSIPKSELNYEVVLTEGRKRQIRKMFGKLGYKVLDLKRVAVGALKLVRLKEGQWRYLTKKELAELSSDAVLIKSKRGRRLNRKI